MNLIRHRVISGLAWFHGISCLVAFGCKNGEPVNPSPASPPTMLLSTVPPPPVTALASATTPTTAPDAPSPSGGLPEVEASEPEDLKPHRIRFIISERNEVFGIVGKENDFTINDPRVSVDGSTGMVLVDTPEGRVLQFRSLDGKRDDVDLVMIDRHCDFNPKTRYKCRRPETVAEVRIANVYLAKHSWVMLRQYWADNPDQGFDNCGTEDLTRHFRASSFEVLFKGSRVRIVRNDGVVITDRHYDVHDPSTSVECREGTRPYAGMFAIDLERRAMAVSLHACHTEGCPMYDRFYFFRLPPPAGTPPATKMP